MKKTILLSLLSISIGFGSSTLLADETVKKAEDRKAVVILFNPPAGMEQEFLDSFAKEQAANFKTHTDGQRKGTESINLIPTKLGEPLIHITIFSDKARFEEAYKAFGPKENRGAYVGKHSEKYGDLNIPKAYLRNSQSFFADVAE